jgi:hypothetical protein
MYSINVFMYVFVCFLIIFIDNMLHYTVILHVLGYRILKYNNV